MSTKNSNYTIGKRTRDLRACSAVPQPTALLRAPFEIKYHMKFLKLKYFKLEKQVANISSDDQVARSPYC